MSDKPQFCTYCGEELVRKETPYTTDYSETRVTLRCPKKKRDDISFLSVLLGPDKHSEVFVDIIDTVLNFDPFTGERIKRGN